MTPKTHSVNSAIQPDPYQQHILLTHFWGVNKLQKELGYVPIKLLNEQLLFL